MSTEFGQNIMRILDQAAIDSQNKLTIVVDDFIRNFPQMIRGGQITQYTVESVLRRFRSDVLKAEQELMHRNTTVSARQIYALFQQQSNSIENQFVHQKNELTELKKQLEQVTLELNDSNNRVQSLANLIEEADVSIQSLMEERDSLHNSVSETIKKYNEVQKENEIFQQKIKKYETQLSAMQNEASSALDNLSSKLADQEKKWQEKFEREERKWQLRLLEASMKQGEINIHADKSSETSTNADIDTVPKPTNDNFKNLTPENEEDKTASKEAVNENADQ